MNVTFSTFNMFYDDVVILVPGRFSFVLALERNVRFAISALELYVGTHGGNIPNGAFIDYQWITITMIVMLIRNMTHHLC